MDPLFNTPYDPMSSKTGGGSFASRPGLIPLSQDRLRRFHPEIWAIKPWMVWLRRQYREHQLFLIHVGEHLRYGLAEPAIVVELDPLLIACYAEELDCVLHLMFVNAMPEHPTIGQWYPEGLQEELIARHHLQVGSRLLALNTFQPIHEEGYAVDIIPGPIARGVYGNFAPYIAEFLTLDQQRVTERKRLVGEHEWQRCQELADEYRSYFQENDFYPRDGRPMMCLHPQKQEWIPGREPPHIRAKSGRK